jgi:hypothetical protein
MDEREFVLTNKEIEEDAKTILHNQRVIGAINDTLGHNRIFPFEQDTIYADHYGQKPSEPHTFEVNGIKITSRVLHQTGLRLSDVAGADLLYEIIGEKFILIQYKRMNETGHVNEDLRQLDTLLTNCPEACYQSRNRPIPMSHLPIKLNAFCGCWYSVVIGEDQKYIHACEVEAIFKSKNTESQSFFKSGISRPSFLELFASCRTGALLRYPSQESLLRRMVGQFLESRHVIFHLIQDGYKHLFH